MAGGRPSIYNQELAATICERLIYGEGLRAICRDDAMPNISTVIIYGGKKLIKFDCKSLIACVLRFEIL